MKKFLIFSIIGLCVLFCSCGALWKMAKQIDFVLTEDRMSKKTEITYCYDKKMPFVFDEMIFIPSKIDDTTHLLLYDSGMSNEISELIPGNAQFPKVRRTMKQTVNGASGRITAKTGLKYYNVESDFFNFKKIVGKAASVSSYVATYSRCTNIIKIDNKPMLGLFAFPNRRNVMLLNFSDTTIMLLDLFGQDYDTTGFMRVKSNDLYSRIEIYLTVDSVEYEFLFDTGYNGFLSLPQSEKHKKENDVSIVGFTSIDISGIVIDTITIQHTNTLSMGYWDSMEGTIRYAKKSTPNMGMEFISCFDWIIDRCRGKVYARKIKDTKCDTVSYQIQYAVLALDTTLQVIRLPLGETEYQLFSIIDSVNGEKVTMENICQMQGLLNKPNGFKDNEMVILPPPQLKK